MLQVCFFQPHSQTITKHAAEWPDCFHQKGKSIFAAITYANQSSKVTLIQWNNRNQNNTGKSLKLKSGRSRKGSNGLLPITFVYLSKRTWTTWVKARLNLYSNLQLVIYHQKNVPLTGSNYNIDSLMRGQVHTAL